MSIEHEYPCTLNEEDKLEIYIGHNDVSFFTDCSDKAAIYLTKEDTHKLITDLQEGLMEQLLEGDTNG